MNYFINEIFLQGFWAGLTISLTAGGVGWMLKLCLQTWNNLIGK